MKTGIKGFKKIGFPAIFLLAFTCVSLTAQQPEKFTKALWCGKGNFVIKKAYRADSVLNSWKQLGISKLFYGVGSFPYSGWTFLDSVINDCHKYKIEFHPYIIAGYKNNINNPVVKEHPGWLVVNSKGEKLTNLNLANAEVRKFITESSAKFLEHNIDGFHLDYIRFDLHQNFSYDSLTCKDFEQEFGTSPLNLDMDTGDPLWCKWIDWNADKVTLLVSDIRKMIIRSGKNIPLSAAVFPDPRASRYEVGQDWERWVNEGLIDIACPMIYLDNSVVFTEDVRNALEICKGKAQVIVGIWLGHRYHRDVDEDTMKEHVMISWKENADGISFWSASSFNKEYQKKFLELPIF